MGAKPSEWKLLVFEYDPWQHLILVLLWSQYRRFVWHTYVYWGKVYTTVRLGLVMVVGTSNARPRLVRHEPVVV